MNHEQMQALGRVLEHFGHDDVKHYEEAGRPPGHIAEALLALDRYRQARSLEGYYAAKVYRGDEAAESTPTAEELVEEPTKPQGPTVLDRGSKEIEARWAKEAIGLAAVELNEVYAQIDITRDGYEIPSGKLYCAAKRLEEAMQRLGLTDDIPF